MASIGIKVPSLGESIKEATLVTWYKKVGDRVKIGENIATIDSDKISLDITSPTTGTLEEISVNPGSIVNIGSDIGKILEGNHDEDKSGEDRKIAENESQEKQLERLSPAARKIVVDQPDINIEAVEGSGRNGRITKADLLQKVGKEEAVKYESEIVQVPETKPANIDNSKNSHRQETRAPMSRLRQTIAKRLKESQQTAALLTTFNEVDVSALLKIRNDYKDQFQKKHGVKLGLMSFFVMAAARALIEIETVNASIVGSDILYHHYCDIGVAVGTDKGLIVPIIRNAETLTLAEIEGQISDLAHKARSGSISMQDISGGTFTITNGGVFGSLLSTPIVNPPQSAILGMHNIVERPVAVQGQVVIRPMMYLALSYDHRLIDGKEAVQFLVKICELVTQPEKLLLSL